jgi:uncharacterized protein (DUF305 family)
VQRPFHSLSVGAILLSSVVVFQNASAQAAPGSIGSGTRRPNYTPADVRFMQGMIAHHAQALVMTALLRGRSSRADMRLLAQRIDVSQQDEIGLMRRWLEKRGEPVPNVDPALEHHDTAGRSMPMPGMSMPGMSMSGMSASNMMMPGMLTPEQLAELAKARGPEFDRLFLQDMIQHHEGALVMVRDLLATNGAAQEPEIFQFSADIDADQRAEIMRMRALLAASPGAKP